MSFPILDMFEQVVIKTFGSTTLFAALVVIILLIILLFAGLDFRVAALICMPLFISFGEIGWIGQGVTGLAWIAFVGFGLYVMWNAIRER